MTRCEFISERASNRKLPVGQFEIVYGSLWDLWFWQHIWSQFGLIAVATQSGRLISFNEFLEEFEMSSFLIPYRNRVCPFAFIFRL